MKRRLFNAIAVVWAVLCVATVALWVQSHWISDYFFVGGIRYRGASFTEERYLISTGRGGIALRALRRSDLAKAMDGHVGLRCGASSGPARSYTGAWVPSAVGVTEIISNKDPEWNGAYVFYGPLLLPVLLTAVLPACYVVRRLGARRHAQRIRSGECGDCGYDLRATPERCPECGAIPRAIPPSRA